MNDTHLGDPAPGTTPGRRRSTASPGALLAFTGAAVLLAASLRTADSPTGVSVHGQGVVSGPERAVAGLLTAAADATAVATVGCLYAAVLLCARGGGDRAVLTPVAWRLQRTGGLTAAAWAVLALAQIPFGLARLIRQPVHVAWNATYLYEYLTGFAAGRLQLLTAVLVPAAALLARAGLRRGTATAALAVVEFALVAQTLAGGQFQPSSAAALAALVAHVVGVAGWAGGVVAIGSLARLDPSRVLPVLRRHSWWATGWVALVGISGALLAVADLPALSDLVATFAGRLVAAKIGLFVAVLTAGWAIRRWLAGRAAVTALRLPYRLLLGEVLLFGCAIGVAAALSLS